MQLSPRKASTVALIAFLVHLVLFAGVLIIGKVVVHSEAVVVESWHLLGGILVWLALLLQFRQRRLAQQEQTDAETYQRLRREGRDSSVFETGTMEETLQLAQRRLVWMEKYLLPIFAVLTSIYLITIGIWQLMVVRAAGEQVFPERSIMLACAAYLAGFAVITFLFSRYAIGMSRHDAWRPLRSGGSYMLSTALVNFVLAIALLLAESGYEQVERIVAYILAALFVVIGVEFVLNLILDFYRPRIPGQYHRAPFESRLLGLFSEPGGILRSVAHALDYQFGFKVSESWFYKLLEKAVLPLIVIQILVLYSMSIIYIVPTSYVAVKERFGKPLNVENPVEAGMHFKFPWPIDRIYTFNTHAVQTLNVGYAAKKPIYDKQGREIINREPLLWTVEHWQEEYPFLVAYDPVGSDKRGPADGETESDATRIFDMLTIGLNVQYRITDVAQYAYSRQSSYFDPRECLEALSSREALHFASRNDIETLLGPGRFETTETLRKRIQAAVDRQSLGMTILNVTMESVHPPIKVAEAFEKVVATLQEKQAKVYEGIGEQHRVLSQAKADQASQLASAKAVKAEKVELARADARRFAQQLQAYQEGRDIFLWREYLRVLDQYLPSLRKYVYLTPSVNNWVYQLDLTEELQPDLFEGLNLDKKQE